MGAVLRDLRQRPVTLPSLFAVGLTALIVALVLGWTMWVAGLAILVPTLLISYNRPQRGILIFAFLLPFDGVIKVLGPAQADSWKQVFIAFLLVLTYLCPPEAKAPRGRKMPGWVPAFIGLLALGIASAFFVDQTTAVVGLRISYFSVLLAVVVWRCPLNRRERDQLVSIFMFLGFFTAVVGIWQQVVGHAYLNSLGYAYDENIRFTVGDTLRSFSTFNLPFSFGFYLMLAVLISLPVALAEPSRTRSKLFFASLPIVALGLLFSFVRGAMLGLAIGLLYLAFHRYKFLVWGIPLVLVAALFVPAGATLTSAVFGSKSLGVRTASWQDRVELIVEHPFGSGIGTTGAAADKTLDIKKLDRDLAFQPDNSYLKVTFELGVLGLWLLLLMLISMFLFTRAVERRVTGIDKDFIAGVSAQFLAIMASSLVATYLELVPMDQLFWLMIAAVATMAPDFGPGPAIGTHEEEITSPA
jgi:putative inorganic carbon (hco3(-)) transporter